MSGLRAGPGELSFDAEIGGTARRVWFRTDAPVTPTADAALAACLLPAMREGGTLTLEGAVSPRLLRTTDEYQTIQGVWSHDWSFGLPPLQAVEVRAPSRAVGAAVPGRGVATFFSGGVDSWAAVLTNRDVTHLIFVRGMDIPVAATELGDEVERRLREAAAAVGRPLYVVETNLRELSDPLVPWEVYYGSALAAVALLLAPLIERVLMTGDLDYEVLLGQGAHPMVDHLWSTEGLEVVHTNARYSRLQRLGLIADHPAVQRTLRVCWQNPGGTYNCGRCRKCLVMMISLELLGARDGVETFPQALDLDSMEGTALTEPLHLALCEEVLQLARERGRPELEAAIAGLLARAQEAFELPPSYRRRRTLRDRGTVTAPTGAGADSSEEEELQATLATVLESRSWRITRPLRALGRWLRARRGRATGDRALRRRSRRDAP